MIEEEEKEKIEALEIVELVDGEIAKTTKIGMNLSTQIKEELVQFLKIFWISAHGVTKTCPT